jgi:cysteine sulfinate desulfinase/cysteine desulfurase-like protein
VIEAMYPETPARAERAIRVSFGPETSTDEVDRAIAILAQVVGRART